MSDNVGKYVPKDEDRMGIFDRRNYDVIPVIAAIAALVVLLMVF